MYVCTHIHVCTYVLLIMDPLQGGHPLRDAARAADVGAAHADGAR